MDAASILLVYASHRAVLARIAKWQGIAAFLLIHIMKADWTCAKSISSIFFQFVSRCLANHFFRGALVLCWPEGGCIMRDVEIIDDTSKLLFTWQIATKVPWTKINVHCCRVKLDFYPIL
jgi:hypothetical protein